MSPFSACELKSQYGHLRTHQGIWTYSDSGGVTVKLNNVGGHEAVNGFMRRIRRQLIVVHSQDRQESGLVYISMLLILAKNSRNGRGCWSWRRVQVCFPIPAGQMLAGINKAARLPIPVRITAGKYLLLESRFSRRIYEELPSTGSIDGFACGIPVA